MHEGGREAGDHDQHRVSENVAVKHLTIITALGLGGQHILLADFIQERILG